MNAPRKLRVLLVEDSMTDVRVLRENLRDTDPALQPELTHVQTLGDALPLLQQGGYDCVLLDLNLPDSSGVVLVETVRAANREVAIIVLTGLDDERSALEALRRGAQEYAVKGRYDGDDLLRILHHAVERNHLLSELDRQREREYFLATHDGLTGLPNRQLLLDRAHAVLNQAERQQAQFALCFIDLDGFKPVNDTHGHAVGDQLLRDVGKLLSDSVRDGDTVARVGGDEFVVLLARVRDVEEVKLVASRMAEKISGLRQINGFNVVISASIGLAVYPAQGKTLDQLMLHADTAMYQIKRARRDGSLASSGVSTASHGSLNQALAESRLSLHFQPWLDVKRKCYEGTEVLVRWPMSGKEPLAPADFLWLAEKNQLLGPLGQWVLKRACDQWVAWKELGFDPGRLAINVSRTELAAADFAASWLGIINQAGMPPVQLQLEVEESVFDSSKGSNVVENLQVLRARGVRVVVDNFGRDATSMMNLARLPIDGIKLDRSLLQGIRLGQPAASALVNGILGFVKALNLKTIMTGVETDADFAKCDELGCRYLQGHWLTPPLAGEHVPALMREPPRTPVSTTP